MRSLLKYLLVGSLITVGLSDAAQALPPWAVLHGNSCAACHERSPEAGGIQGGGEERPDAMSVLSDQSFDPDESIGQRPQDWQDRGELKLFTGMPGQTIELTMQVQHGAEEYAVQLKRFEKEGFSGVGNKLANYITPDLEWDVHGFDDTSYYTSSPEESDGFDWPEDAVNPIFHSFTLSLAPDTPVDLYDLEFATAGIDASATHGKWYGDEHFYLMVVPEPSTGVLLVIGLLASLCVRRRRLEAI